MPEGLQVWNPTGVQLVDISTRTAKILGELVVTARTAGSLTEPGFSEGQPFVYATPIGNSTPAYLRLVTSISGNVLSWSWDASTPIGLQFQLVYGVF